MLKRLGFGDKWRKWITSCITSVSHAVIITEEPSESFKSSKGLRQGDPLSPLLFIVVMKDLNRMLLKARELNLFSGLHVGDGSCMEEITHLFFTDDVLLFCKLKNTAVMNIRYILMGFQVVSDLKINLAKSEFVGTGEMEQQSNLAEVIGCKSSNFPIKYLGLPLGATYKDQRVWELLNSQIERRLAGWKRGLLSEGGCLTLVKRTQCNLPIYYLSLFTIPASVAKKLESIQLKFLSEDSVDARKFHLVAWNELKKQLQKGGLGIRSLIEMNQALQDKWLW